MENILAEVQRELESVVSGIGAAANVPVQSGNLRESIKLRQTGPSSFQLYID